MPQTMNDLPDFKSKDEAWEYAISHDLDFGIYMKILQKLNVKPDIEEKQEIKE